MHWDPNEKGFMRQFGMTTWVLQCPTVRQWFWRAFPSSVWEKHIFLFRSCKDELKMLTNTRLCKVLYPSCTVWPSVDVWKSPTYFFSSQHEVPRSIILTPWSTMRLWYSYTSYCLLSQQSHAYNIQWAINAHELWMGSQTAPCLSQAVFVIWVASLHLSTKEQYSESINGSDMG